MKACEVCGAPLKDDDSLCTNCEGLAAGKEEESATEETLSVETEKKDLELTEVTDKVSEAESKVADDATTEAQVVADNATEAETTDDAKVEESETTDDVVVTEDESENVPLTEETDLLPEELEKKDVDWVGPPDPYEVKQKRKRIAKIIGAGVVAITITILGLFVWQKLSGTTGKAKKEVPIVYIAGDGALKISQRGMDEPLALGNQGYANGVFFAPIILSDDNSMIAYITEAKSLFCLPTTSATTGVIDTQYLVEEVVEEVLAFAPDNNNLYYLGANNVLKMFDGKKSIVISESVYVPSAQSQNMAPSSVLSVLSNNRILYYTGVEMAKVLHTQISTKSNSLKEIGAAETVLALNPEDKGVFFYELLIDEESYSYFCNYYDFKSEAIFEYGDATNLADILHLGVDGEMITMEAIPSTDESVITEFSLDETAAEEPVQNFGVFYLKNGEKKSIIDDLVTFQYIAVDGSFMVFTTVEGDNKACWFMALDKNGIPSEKYQFATTTNNQAIYVTGMPDDKGIIVSVPSEDAKLFSATKFLRKGNKLSDGIVVDDSAELVLHNTVGGKLIIEKNISLVTGPEIEGTSSGSLYVADLYAGDEKGQELLGSGVDLYSPGTTYGSAQHDDKILFLKDCYFNEQGYAYGTLTMYKKGASTEIIKEFLLPSTQEGMAVVYVADDLIYGFNFNMETQKVEMILYSGEGQTKVIDSDIVTLVTGY